MEKEYRELFDGVRASGRLRMEVMNMKREETKRVRRIPRAALIAAALVLALAGTAVAMGNAGAPVKELADYVTAGVDEGGVSQALRHFGLLPLG